MENKPIKLIKVCVVCKEKDLMFQDQDTCKTCREFRVKKNCEILSI